MAAGLSIAEVIVDQVVAERGVAVCKETSTQKSIEIRLLPIRVGRLPAVGERWLVDRTYGGWSFAALYTSTNLFSAPLHVGATAPTSPKAGDRWAPAPVKVWDGAAWVDEA